MRYGGDQRVRTLSCAEQHAQRETDYQRFAVACASVKSLSVTTRSRRR
jgi:hypothetical protein